MHCDVIINAWETGKRSTKHYSTPIISSSYVQLLQHIYCCQIARYDFINAILYLAHFQYSQQLASHASECAVSCTKEHCMYLYQFYGMHIVCTMHNSLCMHSTVSCITCMHFQCFKEKHCTLIVFHNRIFPKIGGDALLAPNTFLGGHDPLDPRGGPHGTSTSIYPYRSYLHTNICIFLHVASPQSKAINRVFEYQQSWEN